MYIKKEDMAHEAKTNVRDGKGTLDFMTVVPKELLQGAGTLFDVITVPSGCTLGIHEHITNFEIYYILEGEAILTDGDEEVILHPGDAHVCSSGNKHAVKNERKEDLKFLAVILNDFSK